MNLRISIFIGLWLTLVPGFLEAGTPDFEFTVRESAGIPRSNEVVCSGMPLPRQANVTNVAQLRVLDSTGQPIPACFHVLARWNAGRDDTQAPLQWILTEMPVSIGANQSRRFQLVVSASTNMPDPAFGNLQVIQANGQIRIGTGAATFSLGGNPNLLFDEIRLADGTWVANGKPLVALANSNQTAHGSARRITVERASKLSAVVVVDGLYDSPRIGGGDLASSRRYQFFAGSPTVLIRHEVAWEGSLFSVGTLAEGGKPNGVRVQLVRDAMDVPWTSPSHVLVWGAIDSAPATGTVTAGDPVELKQRLRAQHTDPRQFDLNLGTIHQTGAAASGGLLAVSDGIRTIAAAFNHMDRYEPQALRWMTNHSLAVDVASDHVWLGARQGLFGQFGICAVPGDIHAQSLKSALWAKVNHPLHAWPDAAWFAASKAVEEFPVGDLPARFQNYDRLLPTVLAHTTNRVDTFGLSGLQTYGLFPRYWGEIGGWNELINPDADPTPSEHWDDIYWGATWTDYHNTSALAAYWAMRSGDCQWLDDISFPAALRMLHTQIIHSAPEDPYFYIGQAPCGYGGYRADFNSSHAYFDNLLLYYWLTGDYSVVETLTRGAATMRQYFYPERPGVPCDPLRPAPNEWAHPVGRVASQWNQVFRFVGLAGKDASFLEDFRGNLARAVSQYYAELEKDGRRYGFWCDFPVTAPGTHHTDQLWMASLYDLNLLHRYLLDSDDTPLGVPPRRPSEVLSAWARTLAYLAPNADAQGDGTLQGAWPTYLKFVWSGARIGGHLDSFGSYFDPVADPYLWETGKATLSAVLSRAGEFTGDPAIRQLAADLAERTIGNSWNQGHPLPLGKEQGLYLARLHAAVARVGNPAQLLFSQTSVKVRENGEGRFFVKMTQAPTVRATVTVARVAGDTHLSVQSSAAMVFTPANWSQWRAVTLRAADDSDTVNGTATFRVAIPGLVTQTVVATELDDDIGVNLALASSGSTITGGARAAKLIDGVHTVNTNYGYTAWTNVPPGTMTLDLKAPTVVSSIRLLNYDWTYRGHRYKIESSLDGTAWVGLVDASTGLHMGWEDWPTNQTARYLRFTGLYNSANHAVCLAEWEVVGGIRPLLVVSRNIVNVRENGEGRFFVKLDRKPAADTTIAVTKVAGGDASLAVKSGGALTFTPTNWSLWQAVTLSAANDSDATNGTATFRAAIPGLATQAVVATELDDDLGPNLALASSGSTIAGGVRAAMLIDGIHTVNTNYGYTVWTNVPPGTMTLDLKATATVSRMRLLNYDWNFRVHQYRMESSLNGSTWSSLVNASTGTHTGWEDWSIASRKARYLRFTGLSNSANFAVCIAEWEVIGTRPGGRRNLAPSQNNAQIAGPRPVSVVTSDGLEDPMGWDAVDGDPNTAWVGQKPGGGYLLVEYAPTLQLMTLGLDLAAGSLTNVEYLYSLDAQKWQPLLEDMERNPVSLNFLWLLFPEDGTVAVPNVLEILPNP